MATTLAYFNFNLDQNDTVPQNKQTRLKRRDVDPHHHQSVPNGNRSQPERNNGNNQTIIINSRVPVPRSLMHTHKTRFAYAVHPCAMCFLFFFSPQRFVLDDIFPGFRLPPPETPCRCKRKTTRCRWRKKAQQQPAPPKLRYRSSSLDVINKKTPEETPPGSLAMVSKNPGPKPNNAAATTPKRKEKMSRKKQAPTGQSFRENIKLPYMPPTSA
jgi:hypothetical protein